MYKIKDTVELKELEKYGFIKFIDYDDEEVYRREICLSMVDGFEVLLIFITRKGISFRINRGSISSAYSQKEFGYFRTRRYLKQLIKDGLVEKVKQ